MSHATTEKAQCASCGRMFPINLLDAKPPQLAGKPATSDALWELTHEDFTVLECETCYGPAWSPT